MPDHTNPYWFVIGFTMLTQFFVFVRWLHRRMRDAEIARTFAHDLATNHLPQIYRVLQLLAEHHGIKIPNPPPVRFIELNGQQSRRS
jgi:hypothetical protein